MNSESKAKSVQSFNLTPIPPLRDYVKNIWVLDCAAADTLEKMIPFGCMDLVYVHQKHIAYRGREIVPLNENEIFVTGQVTQSYDFAYKANAQIIGFGFYPHTAHLFTKFAAHRLTDNICGITDFLPNSKVLELLGDTKDISAKIKILQSFILSEIHKNKASEQKQAYLTFLIGQIFESKGHVNLAAAQQSLKVSKRYMQILFKEYIGIRPSLYAKIVRFLNAIEHKPHGTNGLTTMALELGYYDQAHFNRDFKRFTGLSPKKYFHKPPDLLEQFTSNEMSSLLYNFMPKD